MVKTIQFETGPIQFETWCSTVVHRESDQVPFRKLTLADLVRMATRHWVPDKDITFEIESSTTAKLVLVLNGAETQDKGDGCQVPFKPSLYGDLAAKCEPHIAARIVLAREAGDTSITVSRANVASWCGITEVNQDTWRGIAKCIADTGRSVVVSDGTYTISWGTVGSGTSGYAEAQHKASREQTVSEFLGRIHNLVEATGPGCHSTVLGRSLVVGPEGPIDEGGWTQIGARLAQSFDVEQTPAYIKISWGTSKPKGPSEREPTPAEKTRKLTISATDSGSELSATRAAAIREMVLSDINAKALSGGRIMEWSRDTLLKKCPEANGPAAGAVFRRLMQLLKDDGFDADYKESSLKVTW